MPTDRRKSKCCWKYLTLATLSKSKCSWKYLTLATLSKSILGLNQGFHCEKPAIDRLNCGTAKDVLTK